MGLYECSFGPMMALTLAYMVGVYNHWRFRAKRVENTIMPECKKAATFSEATTRNTAKMNNEGASKLICAQPLCSVDKLTTAVADMYPPLSTVRDIFPQTCFTEESASIQDPPPQLSIVENHPIMIGGGAEPISNLREWLPKEFVIEFNQGLDGVKFGPVGNDSRVTRITSVPEGSKGHLAGLRVNDFVVGVNNGHEEDLCTILKNTNTGKPFKLRARKNEDALADEAWESPTVVPLSPSSIGSSMSLECNLVNSFWENSEVKQRSLSFNMPPRSEKGCCTLPQQDFTFFCDENALFGSSIPADLLQLTTTINCLPF